MEAHVSEVAGDGDAKIQIGIALNDAGKTIVVIDFGMQVVGVGMSPIEAREIASGLLEAADRAEKRAGDEQLGQRELAGPSE